MKLIEQMWSEKIEISKIEKYFNQEINQRK